jgi:tetratricopeptide (TPR) repeat protein
MDCARHSTTRAAVSRIIIAMRGAQTRASVSRALLSAQRAIGVRLLLAIFAALVVAPPALEAAQGQSRDAAVRALAQPDVRGRRDAASRLGEIGTMADARVLLRALKDPDDETRENAEQSLWQIWSRSGDPSIDRLYAAGIHQMEEGELGDAIATFTQIIERKPEFAEAWNKRATLYFLTGELRKSLADSDEVMKRNPYHFGALAGYSQIYIQLEYYERALDYARRALEVNPNMDGVRRSLMMLEHVQEQRRQQMI